MDSINQQQINPKSYNKINFKNLISIPMINLKLISLCFIWYLSSVISSSTTKQILKDFKFPITLTEIQFVMNAFLCLLLLFSVKLFKNLFNINFHKKFPDGTFPPLLLNKNYSIFKNFLYPSYLILKTTIPMGMFQFLGQIASHNATSIIPVSLVHTIKALSPLTTVLIYRFMFKKQFSIITYLTLIPLITGVMLCCTRNDNLNLSDSLFFKGSTFAFISMLIFVSQNIFAKKILTWDDISIKEKDDQNNDDIDRRAKDFLNRFNWKITRAESATSTPILPVSITPPKTPKSTFGLFDNNNSSSNSFNEFQNDKKLDKLSVLFYCSVVGFFLTLPFYLISEYQNLNTLIAPSIIELSSSISDNELYPQLSLSYLNKEVMNLILFYGLSHFIQSLVAFQILGMVSPVNYSIANILKRIIIISCSIIIEGIKLNTQQWLGLSLTFIGLYCYDKWGVVRKKN